MPQLASLLPAFSANVTEADGFRCSGQHRRVMRENTPVPRPTFVPYELEAHSESGAAAAIDPEFQRPRLVMGIGAAGAGTAPGCCEGVLHANSLRVIQRTPVLPTQDHVGSRDRVVAVITPISQLALPMGILKANRPQPRLAASCVLSGLPQGSLGPLHPFIVILLPPRLAGSSAPGAVFGNWPRWGSGL